uniref:Uncharacterized protein n=1 Tax=Oryzias sinensis TaxID=183150 RepID=A0A8C7YNP0_9TELE
CWFGNCGVSSGECYYSIQALDRSETRRDGGFKHSWSFSPPSDNQTSFSSEWVFKTFMFLLQIKIAGLKHVAAVLIIYKLQSSDLYDILQCLRLN